MFDTAAPLTARMLEDGACVFLGAFIVLMAMVPRWRRAPALTVPAWSDAVGDYVVPKIEPAMFNVTYAPPSSPSRRKRGPDGRFVKGR